MAEKSFFDIFNLYSRNDTSGGILSRATDIRVKADRQRRILEISLCLPAIIEKELLYDIEAELAEVYRMACVRILPTYPSECFDKDYIADILAETERTGVVAKGFFSRFDAQIDDGSIIIKLPFSVGGIHLLYDANTPRVIEKIIHAEFGLTYAVKIEGSVGAENYESAIADREMERIQAQVQQASYDYANRSRNTRNTTETIRATIQSIQPGN